MFTELQTQGDCGRGNVALPPVRPGMPPRDGGDVGTEPPGCLQPLQGGGGTRGGSSVLLFLAPWALCLKTIAGNQKTWGERGMMAWRDKRQARGPGERWAPAGTPSHIAQQEGNLLSGFGRASCAAGSWEQWEAEKNFGEEMALLLEKGNFDFLGCQPLLMPF